MGALVAVAYSLCLGRTGAVRVKPLALLVAAAGFVSVFLVPFAKYPTSPPAASTDDTIHDRGTLFLVVLGVAVLGLVAAVVVGQALKLKVGTWNASVIVGVGYLSGSPRCSSRSHRWGTSRPTSPRPASNAPRRPRSRSRTTPGPSSSPASRPTSSPSSVSTPSAST